MKTRYTLLLFMIMVFSIQCQNTNSSNSFSSNTSTSNIYAGIEIGSSGVKYHIIKLLGNNTDKKYETLSKKRMIELEIQSDDYSIIDKALASIIAQISEVIEVKFAELNIAKEDIYIIGSSSLTKAPNIKVVEQKLKAAFPYVNLAFVNARKEAISAMLTANIPMSYDEILFVDIGGGNTKIAGYDDQYSVFLTQEIPLGTRTLLTSTLNKTKEQRTFKEIEQDGVQLITPSLETINKNQSSWNKKHTMILVGGVVYSLAKTLELKVNSNQLARINTSERGENDLQQFRKLLENRESIKGAKYNHEQFFAGLIIMEELVKTFKMNNYYFANQQDWVPGYIIYEKQFQ